MSIFKKLVSKPIIGPLVKYLIKRKVDSEVHTIAEHFSKFLQPCVAADQLGKNASFSIRHNVYCEELKFEDEREDRMEVDEFDDHSLHCLIQHKGTKVYAGTVRAVYSSGEHQLLPLEKFCLDSIDHPTLNPKNFPRHEISEISRLAVPAEFRRRKSDKFEGAATGVINEEVYSEKELRCFPFIAVGLYLSAANVVLERGIKHCFVMMEPRLARSLRLVGIEFEQIGPVIDYHGKRAPYHVDPRTLVKTLPPGFVKLFTSIAQQLDMNWVDEPIETAPALANRIEQILPSVS